MAKEKGDGSAKEEFVFQASPSVFQGVLRQPATAAIASDHVQGEVEGGKSEEKRRETAQDKSSNAQSLRQGHTAPPPQNKSRVNKIKKKKKKRGMTKTARTQTQWKDVQARDPPPPTEKEEGILGKVGAHVEEEEERKKKNEKNKKRDNDNNAKKYRHN